MRNLNDVIESTKNDTSTIGTKAPKIRNLSDVSKTSYFNIDDFKDEITKIAPAPDVESDLDVRLREGIDRGVQSVKNLPEHLQIFQGQMTMALGGLAGSEENVEIGRELIKSAFGEIQADEKKFYENSIPLSEKDYDSFGYALGNGVANYGSMLAFGYLTGGVGGLALGGALETGSKAREKIEYHIEKTGDNALDQYTSTQAGKDALFTAVYSAGSTIIEKKFGYGAQRKLFKMPVGQHLKNIYKSALSEGGTETAQELYAVGLDLLGGYIDYSKLPERFLGAVQEGVIGSVLGGTAGVGTAIAHRSQAKSILREELKNTVPAKDLENVVNSVYEEVSDTMTKVVATELVQSESLRNKHGAIYESLKAEIRKQITDSGAYTDVDEFKLSQYIESTAKDFADQVLGEANKRKVTIDDVLKASDITYRDGRLYLQGKIEKPKAKRKPIQYNPERMELLTYLKYIGGLKDVGGDLKAMDAGKLKIGLINNKSGMSIDDAMLYAWENGYFPEFVNRPTVDDLLEAIRDSLSGKKRYRESFRPVLEAREAKKRGLLAEAENEYLFDDLLSARFTDDELKYMPLDVKQKLYVEMVDQINAVSEDDYIQQEIDSLTDDEAERYAIMTENGATHDEAMQEIESNRLYNEETLSFLQTEELNDESKNIEFNMVSLKDKTSVDYLKEVALSKGMTNKQFDALMNKVFTVADSINDALKDNPDWKQWNAKQIKTFADSQGIPLPIRSIFVKNGDYDFNIDLGTLCVKREFADKVISHLIDKGYGNQIGLVKLEQIKALLRKYEIAVACDVCFIEGKRLNARTLSNGLAYEWESVRIALGINDNLSIGSKRTFTEEQNKMLEQMTDRRFVKDDGSIMSEEEYDSMSTEDKKNFAKEHQMVFQKAYEDYMPVERRRVKIGKTVYDRGITSDKMYSIAKLFRQNSELAGVFDPDTLMNSEQTTALVERYFDTELPSFIGSYAGAGTPKPLLGFNPYYELSWRDKYDRNADRLNQMLFEIGGVRGQSFSDYNEMLVIDYIQKYLALTVRALPSHEYTKQSSLVKTFGDIGVMYNMSFVPKIEDGIDAKHYGLRRATEEEIKNGKSKEGFILKEDNQGVWTYSFHEDSFPIKDAIELRDKFDKTSGIIVVGVSDMQIEMMLNDPMIDMIIPFHASGMPAHTKLMTGLVDVDYSKVQTTKGLKTGQDDFSYNAKLREIGDPRKTAQAYIDWCRENGLTEKFPQFSKNENYYKLLEDFRGYDKNGNPIIQNSVDVSKADWNRIQTEGISGVKERYNVVKTAESTLVSEEFTKELEDIFRYQQVDTEVQNLFKKRLTGVLGKGNAIFLKQKLFLEKVRELSGAEVFRSNQDGTVYGFAQGNKVYINESVFNAHTPAHEFTHIWSKVVQQYNPKLWKKGVELLKETNMWKDVQKDEMYWQIQGDENAVAREVLARLTGTESENMIKQMLDYHTKGHANAKSLVQRIMNFIKEMFSTLKDAFNLKSDIDITFEDFIRMPLRDLLDVSRHKTFKDAQKKINKDGISEFNDKSIEYNAVSKLKQNKIKGAFDKLTKSIKITSEADYSTYKHEFAHFWLDNIWNYANSGQASENYLKQFNELKKWLGTKGNYPTPNQHEKFARAYEKYIYNGTYAKSPIGDVFGEYENFIREVYSDISEIDTRAGVEYKPIPRVVYNFFDSMVSGKLPGVIIDDEPKKEVEKDEKEVREFIKEENKILEENRANYTLKPVQTDTKTGYLTAYEKMTGEQVEAGSIELKDQIEKAENFVANNLEQAERIVNGLEQAPEGIVKNAVYVAYNNLQKKLGNTDKRANSMLNQALELRRMGQEIASQRLAYADIEGEASATFWIKEVIKNKAEALADANGLTVTELSDKIDNAISDGIANNKKPEDIVKQLGEELGVTEFYQTEVLSGFGDVDTYAYSYIKRYVNERLGLGMSKTEAETIIRKADDMLASLQNSMSKTGNPNVDYFVKLKDMESYANSLAPSSEARVAMSVIGRGNLLASIKSPVTNIVSNGFVGAFRGAVRRINLGVANSIVSPELIKQNKAYSWEIFKKTGYNVNNITKDKPRNLILGEKLTHSEGKGFIRKLGRIYENTVYKWGLGAGDVLFKDYAFTDYVALKSTKLANGDVNKANEIFEDACLIEPKTKEGAEIREEAIQESLIATYQNDSAISDRALKVRKTMDFGVGFGEFIAPFVKTPANVVSMGLKSGFGGVKAIVSEIQRDLKAGKIQPMTKENIDLLVQNGLGVLVASLLISAIDDEDYMPPYALASSKDKQLAKELNIPYNAIRIGNTWVSLDYLGVLASPLVGLLQARREDGVINSIFGYAKSGGIQALSIPAFGNIADLFENIKNTVRKDGVDALADAGGEVLEQAYARAVPSIISDVAKALDLYDRETKGNEIITKIPFARETADKRVSATTGKAEKLGNPVFDILFGARVKEQVSNPVAEELLRLNNAGWGVSLTTVTRSGLLSELDEETKQKVREDFATEYSKDVSRLIKSFRYSKADDEEKQDMINKIRRDIISKLKKRYLKNRK